jgi:hypothetical protein
LGSYSCEKGTIELGVITRKDDKDHLVQTKTFSYCDTLSKARDTIVFQNKTTFTWLCQPESITQVINTETGVTTREAKIVPAFTKIFYEPKSYILYNKDLKTQNAMGLNLKFLLSVQDSVGNKVTDSVIYFNNQTMADFDVWLWNKEEGQYKKPDKDSILEEAPLKVRFQNKSRNGEIFKWILSTDSLTNTNYVFDSNDSACLQEFIYYLPSVHKARLASTNSEKCTDTTEFRPIKVSNSRIGELNNKSKLNRKEFEDAFPKYFNPDSPEAKNKKFLYKEATDTSLFASIKTFQIKIYNQWGMKVYEDITTSGQKWEGWDGKVQRGLGGGDASPGLYYYVYQAEGYGNINSATVKTDWIGGYFYLFRNQ